MLLFSVLIFVSGALFFWRPTFGVTLLLLGLVVLPILKGWRMSFETADSFPLGVIGSLSTGWIQIIRWIGYVVGVFSRTEANPSGPGSWARVERDHFPTSKQSGRGHLFSHSRLDVYVSALSTDGAPVCAKNYLVFYHTDNLRSDAFVGFQEVEPMLFVTPAPLETFGELSAPIFYVNSPWLAPIIPWLKDPVVIYDHCDDILVSAGQAQDHDELLTIRIWRWQAAINF